MSNLQKPLRWGIIGAGIIADKMAGAIALVDGCTLVAVASRTASKAALFAERHAPAVPCTYEALVANPDIDVVYIATTHNFHFDNVQLALAAGKHVLVEKPMSVNAKEARILVQMARTRGLFLMEALWTRCLPSMKLLRKMLNEGAIGEVNAIQIGFGSMASPRYIQRLYSPELAGGVTLDMGIYPLSVSCYLMGALPEEVHSMARFRESGVDEMVQFMLRFPGQRFASLMCSFGLRMSNAAEIYGTLGRVHFPNFHQGDAFELIVYGEDKAAPNHSWLRPVQAANGFVHEVEEVLRCIRSGRLESDAMPLDESVAIMEIMDQMRAEWGLRYPFE